MSDPVWTPVGPARLTGALVTEDLAGDGYNVVLAYDDGGEGHTIVVYVDNNLGGIAKDTFPGPPVKVVLATYAGQDDVVVREVSVPRAVGLILAALENSGAAPGEYLSADFRRYQEFLVGRVAAVDAPVEWPQRPAGVPLGVRRELVGRFLASGYSTDLHCSEALTAEIARLWVDHAVDRTVGGPLRVSAVLVELFLADWVPRVYGRASAEALLAVPEVVRAWLRFAADETPVPRSLVTDAVAAIERWAPVMRRRCSDPAAWERPIEQLAPEPEDDELEAMWFTLSGLGQAPRPDVTGLDRATAAKLTDLARGAWVLAGEHLGTDFAGRAFAIAERLVREAPELLARTKVRTLQLAITWLISEDELVFHSPRGRGIMSARRWAAELGTTPQTMQPKAKAIRAALGLPSKMDR
jgi:hypothetical protein